MSIYDIFMAPLELLLLGQRMRGAVIGLAAGSVLEVGTGSGANFRYYDYSKITSFTSLDLSLPSEREQAKAAKLCLRPTQFMAGSVEALPFEAESFDSVVVSLVLCTADARKSLSEIKRVLKTGGKYIFIEHVRPTGAFTGWIADKLNPLWQKLANGCNINRHTDAMLMDSGFVDVQMEQKLIFRYGVAIKQKVDK